MNDQRSKFQSKVIESDVLESIRSRKFIPLISPFSLFFSSLAVLLAPVISILSEDLSDSDPIRSALARLFGYRRMEFPKWIILHSRCLRREIKAEIDARVREMINTPIYIIPRRKYVIRRLNIARVSLAYTRFFVYII